MSTLRFKVVEEAFKKRPVPVTAPAERPSAYYATYVFNQEKMRKYLPLEVYQRYAETLDTGRPLDMHTANAIAQGMKQWAIEMGIIPTGFNPSPRARPRNTTPSSSTTVRVA